MGFGSSLFSMLSISSIIIVLEYKYKSMTLNEWKSFLYPPKHLKTLVMERINGERK